MNYGMSIDVKISKDGTNPVSFIDERMSVNRNKQNDQIMTLDKDITPSKASPSVKSNGGNSAYNC